MKTYQNFFAVCEEQAKKSQLAERGNINIVSVDWDEFLKINIYAEKIMTVQFFCALSHLQIFI